MVIASEQYTKSVGTTTYGTRVLLGWALAHRMGASLGRRTIECYSSSGTCRKSVYVPEKPSETSKARWIMVDVSAHSGGWVYGQPLPPLRETTSPHHHRNGSFQTASPSRFQHPRHHPPFPDYDQRPLPSCSSTDPTLCCWSPWLLLSLLVCLFCSELVLVVAIITTRRDHQKKKKSFPPPAASPTRPLSAQAVNHLPSLFCNYQTSLACF
ncbi:hypothetical protein BDW74DRAFT_62114 [Aspergillus multicolor]|uniref:uncharacterized protein n=1 Tax=Aspergillus multicolor TaxID=41759 RepID=UPI003CCCFF44